MPELTCRQPLADLSQEADYLIDVARRRAPVDEAHAQSEPTAQARRGQECPAGCQQLAGEAFVEFIKCFVRHPPARHISKTHDAQPPRAEDLETPSLLQSALGIVRQRAAALHQCAEPAQT